MLYRVKQFFKALTSKVTMDDRRFINSYLNEKERRLFFSMPGYEQTHSLRVARDVLESNRVSTDKHEILVKAALLHDIGKLSGGLNIITKSIMVLLDKAIPKIIRRFGKLKAVDTYYNHPERAFLYIKDEGDYFSYLIRNHHNYSIRGDDGLKLLQDADSRN